MKKLLLSIILSASVLYSYAGYRYRPEDEYDGGFVWLTGKELLICAVVLVAALVLLLISTKFDKLAKEDGKETISSKVFGYVGLFCVPIIIFMAYMCWQIILPIGLFIAWYGARRKK